jgi:hypothetical protein
MMLEKSQHFLEVYDKREEFTNYVSLDELKKKGKIREVEELGDIVQKLAYKFSERHHDRVMELMGRKVDWMAAIEALLEKIGWEMGQVKRIFCEKSINWGFFNDHGDWHCNAHLNNFVFARPASQQRLCKPLDFDLAFTK